jgi:Cu-Zn family superoxide dismutase
LNACSQELPDRNSSIFPVSLAKFMHPYRKEKYMTTLIPLSILHLLFLSQFSFADGEPPRAIVAHASLESKSGSKVSGMVNFKDTPSGLQIDYKIHGLSKNTQHGFHIHVNGDCSSNDAKSAGTHYIPIAPTGGTSLETPQKFAGDLPAIAADQNGAAEGQVVITNLSINGINPVANRAVIVHAGPDNAKKKSTARIACGIIKME